MSANLIHTKISIPPSRAQLVHRERLYHELNRSAEHKLTLIAAPAGFGKSTLLSSWAGQSRSRIAWHALDEGDNDPDRFLSYTLSALQAVAPDLSLLESTSALRQAHEKNAIETLLAYLINEIGELREPVTLVLDDYHQIQNPAVDDILLFLLEHAPSTFRLIIASRREPGFPFARLRASGQVLEFTEKDLRFTTEEASQFLLDIMGLPVSKEEIILLEERTEGWAAGLQLVALSLEGREDAEAFITSLRGTDRYILDYMGEEVFSRLPDILQDFMLRISVVERFNADLCDALVEDWGASNWANLEGLTVELAGQRSRPLLEFLDASNLFVIPLDHERQWYRFHQLFSDFLQDQLEALHPELIPELHRRAFGWFLTQGSLAEAIQHALLAGDPEAAAALIEDRVKPMLSTGETRMLTRWIEALGEDVVKTRPSLLFGRVWSYILTDPVRFQSEIQQTVVQLANALETSPETILAALSSPGLDSIRLDHLGQFALLLAFLSRDSQPHDSVIGLFQAAESAFPAEDFFTRAFARSGLASTYARQGSLVLAEQAFAEAAELGQRADSLYVSLIARDWEASIQAQRGQLNRAAATYREVIEQFSTLPAERLPLSAHAYVGLADILREQNELLLAKEFVGAGLERGRRSMDRDALREGYMIQARILQALGEKAASRQALQLGLGEAYASGSPHCHAEAEAWQVILNLAWGDLRAARQWAAERDLREAVAPEKLDSLQWIERMALARLRIAEGNLSRAEFVLKRMLEGVSASELVRLTIEIRCALSMTLLARGDRESAQPMLAKALHEGEPEGFMRCFLDEGPRMAALLRSAAVSGQSPEYVERLLTAFGQTLSMDEPIEPLSERELDVLRLLSDGLTNAAIADQLVIAQSTVKTHINHIYAKLGVSRRTQAVVRARELHLLS